MATVPTPPKSTSGKAGGTPTPAVTSGSDRAEKKPLQFMVDSDFHREFKGYANDRGMKMSDLFKEMYDLYRSENS